MKPNKQTIFVSILAAALIALASIDAYAAAPANDNFASAQLIAGVSGSATGTNVDATKQPGEPAHANNRGGRSVWFKYVAPGNGVLVLDTFGSNLDTILAVYQGTGINDLVFIAGSDDITTRFGNDAVSRVTFGTQTGATYYFVVDGQMGLFGAVPVGPIKLNYQLNNAPENDTFATFANYADLSSGSRPKILSFTNVGASKELGEPNHAGNPGGKSVWIKITVVGYRPSLTFTLEGKSIASPSAGITTLMALYQGTSLASLVPLSSTVIPAGHTGTLTLNATVDADFYLAVDGFDGGAGASTGNFLLEYGATKSRKHPDLDRDGTTDITVFRPTTGSWYSLDSSTGNFRAYQWGANGDKPLFNQWDDDDRPDYAVFRPDTQIWHVIRSFNNNYTPFAWGLNTDIPLTLNHFTQGVINCYGAVFRQTTGTWWIRANAGSFAFQFGQNGDIPMTADFDGDGTDEIAVFRPSNGVWYIANPFTGALVKIQQFGAAGDIPVPADYEGDGRIDIAVYRPSNGVWYVLYSQNGNVAAVAFGLSTDKPQPADYTHDGIDDIAVFRPSNGTWYIRRSPINDVIGIQFGLNGDIPMSAPLY